MRHHADPAGGTVCLRGVVLPDEEIRVCGGEAPRRSRRRSWLTQGRGASGRRNKGLRGMRHHAVRAGGAVWLRGVVLPDEEIRVWRG